MQDAHEVGAIVDGHVRLARDERPDVSGVAVQILAVDGVHLHPIAGDERRGDVVLRGQRVRGAQRHVRSPGDERAHEVRRLGGDVQAQRDRHAVERALGGETVADAAQDRHLPPGPCDPRVAGRGQAEVGDVVRGELSPGGDGLVPSSSGSCRACTGRRPAR